MNGYYSTEDQWSLNCSIVFANNQVWFTFPEEQGCFLDHDGLGTSTPFYLEAALRHGEIGVLLIHERAQSRRGG